MRNKKGFSLIELAIVLVIIGIIIGMAFKGKQLIDGAKVKRLATQYDKYNAAINIFYERYNRIPGDGCGSGVPTTALCTGAQDGQLTVANERNGLIAELIDVTEILPETEKTSAIDVAWSVTSTGRQVFMTLLAADTRFACAVDQMIDDGDPANGLVTAVMGTEAAYTTTTNCWEYTGTVTSVSMRVLP